MDKSKKPNCVLSQMDAIAEELDDAASVRSSKRGPIGAVMTRINTMQRNTSFVR